MEKKNVITTLAGAAAEHPLELFAHCPKCGSPHFGVVNAKAKKCEDCGFEYYANAQAACACFITDLMENMLVAVRGKEPAIGTYDLPGGFVDMDETAEEAMARELMEETGIDAFGGLRGGIHRPPKYLFSLPNLYLYSGMTLHTLDLFYHLKVESLVPYVDQAGDDVAKLLIVPIREIVPADFGLRSIRRAVEMVREEHYF